MPTVAALCANSNCRLLSGHSGLHNPYPTSAWNFFRDKDKKKIVKAGFATPRGGNKGAYQNHVDRSNKVIIPYERLGIVDLDLYKDGYVIRLFPDQYFESNGQPKAEFMQPTSPVKIGENAFVLYRSYPIFESLPPLEGWSIRGLELDGEVVARRSKLVVDTGHYVLRLPTAGNGRAERNEGPPQGIFAPEYADEKTNYLAKCMLAWLIINTLGAPYEKSQAGHLEAILKAEGLGDLQDLAKKGAMRRDLTSCPLCLRIIKYEQVHNMVSFDEEAGLENAGMQVEGATRSTEVNLYHQIPLVYNALQHTPDYVAWGHATCNTRLGQRVSFSLANLLADNIQINVRKDDTDAHIGWMSKDRQMIRSPQGAVWIQICDDMTAAEELGVEAHPDSGTDLTVDLDELET